ncbi:MAG TPA: hypothetical protein VF548_13690 [Allosphingosinicella sp.]
MKLFHLLLASLLLAACGDQEEERDGPPANNVEELENKLEKLAVGAGEETEPAPRMSNLKESDLGPEHRSNPACRLHRGGRLLLVVNAAGGVARIDGRRVGLALSGPVGPTGGFLTAPGITISVGRTEPGGEEAAQYGMGWPARATVGGDKNRPLEKLEATWICVR